MKIDCISDLHDYYPYDMWGGDLLICAGDVRDGSSPHKFIAFMYEMLDRYDKIVFIAGNHDFEIRSKQQQYLFWFNADNRITYLLDSGCDYKGLKIWGSPWTPPFFDWAFMAKEDVIKQKWALIPDDTDILVTHGPALGILDEVGVRNCGCPHLKARIDAINPALHVFGHIHEGRGWLKSGDTCYVNACLMNANYHAVNRPFRVILEEKEDRLAVESVMDLPLEVSVPLQ